MSTQVSLNGITAQAAKAGASDNILVAHDLSPADMVLFKQHPFAGFITDLGGMTSHTAIIARSLNIPAVMALHSAHALVQEGDLLIVDGVAGEKTWTTLFALKPGRVQFNRKGPMQKMFVHVLAD